MQQGTEAAGRALFAAPYRRALVVCNPISGRGQGIQAAREFAEGLRQRGVPSSVYETKARGDAFTRLRELEADTDLVVSVGGDGTLREVLEGLVDTEIPVLPLPFGTANVLAAELGFPRDVHAALEIAMRRRLQALDVAHVKGHLSFLVTGVGLDAAIVREVDARRSGPITKWSYVGAVLRTLWRYRFPSLRVEVDGEALEGTFGFVLVANTTRYAGLLNLDENARLDDRRFEVYLFRIRGLWSLARACLRGALLRLPGGPVERRHATHVRVSSEEPVPYQVDGDVGGETPLELELAPNQYRLVVP